MIRQIRRITMLYSLSNEERLARAKCFYPHTSSIQSDAILYSFNLALHSGNSYEGVADIRFRLEKKNELFLDFQGKTVKSIIINENQVEPSEVYGEGKINLPLNLLSEGNNEICINYENEYDKDGSGCVSFVDVDEKQYLYTQFEPYMGNRVFPMFDQPDLKAKMKLSISCPATWEQVLSNEDAVANEAGSGLVSPVGKLAAAVLNNFASSIPNSYKKVSFRQTKLLPSYLYCFVVGPYKKHVCQNTYQGIPMNLYSIQSLFPYMLRLAPFIEEMTNKSMQFFEQYFGYPYPFNKYDQVFAHQYKWGAMENAGIVTFNDLYIFKDPVSTEKMLGFGNTIVHELAHHWFGNLVTMRWWDDLWLNESFAEYISHFCLQKIKGNVTTLNYQSAMNSFLSRKTWGYEDDELITTHPIRSQIDNTQMAESIFDGITYSKGAATMKQLMYLMGQENFSKALKHYFHKFAFQNAELNDLLQSLKLYYKSSKNSVTIDEWKQMWLETAGFNILSHRLVADESALIIYQSAYHAETHPTLRSHRIKVAAIRQAKIQSIQITVLAQPETVIQLSAKQLKMFKESDAILLNFDDLTFAKVIIDKKSISYFKENLKSIDNILLRSAVWKNFCGMAKSADLPSQEYIRIIANNTFAQKSDVILQENLNNAYLIIWKYTPQALRKELMDIMFSKCYQSMAEKSLSQNRRVILKNKLVSFTYEFTKQNIELLEEWYTEKESSRLFTTFGSPNITERWSIIIRLIAAPLNLERKLWLLNDMKSRDTSDVMKNNVLICQNLMLSDEEMIGKFSSFTSDPNIQWSMNSFTYSLIGYNHRVHCAVLRRNLRQKYMEAVKDCSEGRNAGYPILQKNEMLELFIKHMDPEVEENVQDLEWKVQKFDEISVFNNDKIKTIIHKKIDVLKKRIACYRLNV